MERGRPPIWINRVMLGLLGFFVIATLGRALVGGITLLDVNLLTRFAPWQALHGPDTLTSNLCRGDTVDSAMPSIAAIRARLFSGDFPGWSASLVGGSTLGGLPNYGQFSPLSLPFYALPLWLAPAFVKLGEFAVAIGGMTLFLRRLRLSVASGILAGIIFVSSGFMLGWTNWPQTRVAAFIPALFWVTERLVQRQRLVDALPLAAVVASMLLGGFPAVTGMALYCAALYFLARLVMVGRSRWKTSVSAGLLAALGLTMGAALTAFQLVPFAKNLSTLSLGYRAQSGEHSALSSLITTVVPDAQGVCANGVSTGPAITTENLAFVGVAAIVLCLVAILMRARRVPITQRRVVGFLGVAVVVVVILGWVGGPLLHLVQQFPVFSNNSIHRIRVLLGFLVATLAGFGFERLLSIARDHDHDPHHPEGGSDDRPNDAAGPAKGPLPTPGQPRFRLVGFWLWCLVVLTVTAFFALAVLGAAISQARTQQATPQLRLALVAPAILLLLCVASVIAARFGPRWARYAAIVAISVIAVGQSASAFRALVPGGNPDNFYPVTSTHRFLQQNLGSDRFAGSDLMMYPSTSTYYELRTPTGHAFATPAWMALLGAVDPASALTPTFSDFTGKALNAGTAGRIPILDQMAVRYFVTTDAGLAGTAIDPPAPASTVTLAPEQHARCTPTSGPLRGVTVYTAGPLRSAGPAGVTVHVKMHTPRGELTGARYLGVGPSAPTSIPVAIPGEDLTTADPVTADVWVSGVSGAFALRSNGAAVSCGKVVPVQDGLKLASSADGTIVYQRLTSLPRIRWASASSVQTDPAARVAHLKAGISPDAVVLNTPGPVASGKAATVRVTRDDGDTVAATVDAAGAGYLVVADSLQQPGWSATVDGRPATLMPANNAMVTVPVSAGVHRVELTYTVPGRQRTGTFVTGAAFLVCLGIVALWWRRSSRGVALRKRQDTVEASPTVSRLSG